MSKGIIAKHLMSMSEKGRLRKGPPLVINAGVDTFIGGPVADKKYERKERKRIRKEITALRKHLNNLDPDFVMKQTKASLQRELAVKKARLAEYDARLGDVESSEEEPDGGMES